MRNRIRRLDLHRLPYIKRQVSKGRTYRYYIQENGERVKLPDLPEWHPEFIKAYSEAFEADPGVVVRSQSKAGSLAQLCEQYLSAYEYTRLAQNTKNVRGRIVEKIKEKRGAAPVRQIKPEHLRKDIRQIEKPAAARNRVQTWRALMKFALEQDWIDVDPADGLKPPRYKQQPYPQWEQAHIEQFRNYWQMGTPQRTAFEIYQWTGARCVDVRRLGWQMVDQSGWLAFTQEKTGGLVTIPLGAKLPSWAVKLRADQLLVLEALKYAGEMTWVVTRSGAPRSEKAISQWMSKAAKEAGLPAGYTAHGIRKARAASLAEIGGTTHQIGAWTGHEDLREVQHYTREADKRAILMRSETESKLGASDEQLLENNIKSFPK